MIQGKKLKVAAFGASTLALCLSMVLAAVYAAPAAAFTQTTIPAPDGMTPPEPPQGGLHWNVLKGVDEAADPSKAHAKFGPDVSALDGKDVKLRGYMMPLEQAARQSRFVLTALPPSCPFCLPAGPDQLVEVQCKDAVKFTFDPVTIGGRLQLVRDDPAGLLYRIVEAKQIGD